MFLKFILWRGSLCVLLLTVMVSIHVGVYEVVILQMPNRSPREQWLRVFLLTCKSTFPPPHKTVSLFLFSHGVCYSLPALDPLLGLDLFVWQMIGFLPDWPVYTVRKCAFVWYLNQTAAGSGPGVCVIIIFKCTYGEMRAKLWVLCYLPIFCFSFDSYYYLNLRD